MGLDSAGKSTLLARLLTGQVRLLWTGRYYVGCKRVDISVCPGVNVICELQGDGNVTDYRIQRRNFGPGQEDISDCLGCRWTEAHETQLEVNIKQTPNKHTNKQKSSSSGMDDCWALINLLLQVLPGRL